MMDSHDTNEPLREDLEEVKKTAETEEPSNVENSQDSADLAIAQQETTEVKEEQVPEEIVVEDTPEESSPDTVVEITEVAQPVETVKEAPETEPVDIAAKAEEAEETKDMEAEQADEIKTGETQETQTDEIEIGETKDLQTKIMTQEDILKRLKELAVDAEKANKQELDSLKQSFYKLHNTQLEAKKKAFIEEGGAEEDFFPPTDELEVEFKNIFSAIKEKRNRLTAEQEKQKEENLIIKLSIIDRLKELVESSEDTNKSYHEFKKLQQQWKDIKLVPQAKVNELWKSYQHYVEKFYDILKLNNEFRDYDFRKNLEIKNRLIEAAEKLENEPDAISAFHQLQKLHQEFRDTGPVAKDLREEVWARFKAASAIVNRRHQEHFEAIKELEQHNLDQKTVICEIVEAIEYDQLKSFSTWEAKTKEVVALQKKWKTIGYAPHRVNMKIFDRFRKACDEFFNIKAEFFKNLKEEMTVNLELKTALCEKAEALKDNTDWKATTDAFIKLQKEWKSIGPVQKKHSEALWKQFITACDYFFEQKSKATSSQRNIEVDNLKKKKSILEQLDAIDETMETEEAEELVRELIKEWNTIGHVPFRDKDKLYKQYRDNINRLFERFNISTSRRKLNNYRSNISERSGSGGQNSLYKERERLMRTHENMKNEILTYENNIGFLTSSSKKGNSLVIEITRKVEKLKAELELVSQKIKVIDNSLREEQNQ